MKLQLEDRDRHQREEIARASISQEEKERLLREHEKTIEKLKVKFAFMFAEAFLKKTTREVLFHL